jgi:hypothetical protein
MVDVIDAGLLDLSPLHHNVFPLERVNEAISRAAQRGLQRFHHQPTTAHRAVAARNHSLSGQTCEGKHHARQRHNAAGAGTRSDGSADSFQRLRHKETVQPSSRQRLHLLRCRPPGWATSTRVSRPTKYYPAPAGGTFTSAAVRGRSRMTR